MSRHSHVERILAYLRVRSEVEGQKPVDILLVCLSAGFQESNCCVSYLVVRVCYKGRSAEPTVSFSNGMM